MSDSADALEQDERWLAERTEFYLSRPFEGWNVSELCPSEIGWEKIPLGCFWKRKNHTDTTMSSLLTLVLLTIHWIAEERQQVLYTYGSVAVGVTPEYWHVKMEPGDIIKKTVREQPLLGWRESSTN